MWFCLAQKYFGYSRDEVVVASGLATDANDEAFGGRYNGLTATDWRAILEWLREPQGQEPLRIVNQRQWSTGLLAGGLERLELQKNELDTDDAAVIGALLPRSGTSLTVLDLA